jgi:hypothetical protein
MSGRRIGRVAGGRIGGLAGLTERTVNDRVEAEVELPAGDGSRRRVPRRLWLIVVLQGLLMLATTILYPPFQNPDEQAHVDYVLAHRNGVWLDGPGERFYQSGVVAAVNEVPPIQFQTHVGGQAPVPRGQRKSFDALGTALDPSFQPNQMVQHPPLYYELAAGWSYLLPGFSDRGFDVEVFWLRLLSLVLMLPVPLLIYGAGRRITGSTTVGLLAAAIPLSIPSYLRTGASVTNDALLVLLTSLLLAVLVRVAWGDLSRRTAGYAGALWGAALLTKGFALTLPVVIVASYLVATPGPLRQRIRAGWPPALLCGIVGAAIGAWWWIRNLIVYGAVQPNGFGKTYAAYIDSTLLTGRPHGTTAGLPWAFTHLLVPRLWGSLGLIDIPSLPTPILWAPALLATALLIAALLRRDPTIGWGPARTATLILPIALTLALMAYGTRRDWLLGQQLPGLQVRYLVPDFLPVMVCIAVAASWLAGRRQRWLPPLVITATIAFLTASALWVLLVEMSPNIPSRTSRLQHALDYIAGWAPWRATVSLLISAATALAALTAIVAFWWAATSEHHPIGTESPD